MSKKTMIKKVVQCPVCNTQTFNTVSLCKCGYKFPYDPIQDEIVVDICSNCGQINQYKNGDHIGGNYTMCPLCKNGKLTTLNTLDKWSKMSDDEKQKAISLVYKKTDNSNLCKPTCPTCKSTNIEKISVGKKVFGGAMFGLFSSDVRNTMHCKNCGYKW